jgi:hypothetical protein
VLSLIQSTIQTKGECAITNSKNNPKKLKLSRIRNKVVSNNKWSDTETEREGEGDKAYGSPTRKSFAGERRVSERERRVTGSDHARARESIVVCFSHKVV